MVVVHVERKGVCFQVLVVVSRAVLRSGASINFQFNGMLQEKREAGLRFYRLRPVHSFLAFVRLARFGGSQYRGDDNKYVPKDDEGVQYIGVPVECFVIQRVKVVLGVEDCFPHLFRVFNLSNLPMRRNVTVRHPYLSSNPYQVINMPLVDAFGV